MDQEKFQSILLISIIIFGAISSLFSIEKTLSKHHKLKQILLVLFILLTAIAGVANHYTSKSLREHEQEIFKEERQHFQEELKKHISNEFSNLPLSLRAKINFSEYLSKYPEGFVIFQLGVLTPIIPLYSNLSDHYDIDWRSAKITKNTDTEIELHLPNIRTRGGSKEYFGGVTGGKKQVGNLGGFIFNDIIIWGEILEINPSNIVFLVGMEPSNLQKTKAIESLISDEIDKIHELYNRKEYRAIMEMYSADNDTLKPYYVKVLKGYKKSLGNFSSKVNSWQTTNINQIPNVAQVNLNSSFEKKETFEYFEFIIIDESPVLLDWYINHEVLDQVDIFHDLYNNGSYKALWSESSDSLRILINEQNFLNIARQNKAKLGEHVENLIIRPKRVQFPYHEVIVIDIEAKFDSATVREVLNFQFEDNLWRLHGWGLY